MDILVGYLNYLLYFAITAGIFAVLCLGLNLQWGYTGLFNIGIAGFYAVGAYTYALISGLPPEPTEPRLVGGYELPFLVGIVAAMVASGIIAFLISLPTLRLREDYLAIATIGIAEVIRLVLQNEAWLTNGVWGIKEIPAPLDKPIKQAVGAASSADLPDWLANFISNGYNWFYLFVVIAVIVLIYLFLQRLVNAPWGRVLMAVREDEVVASFAGKDTYWYKVQSMVIGAMIMGAAGALLAANAKFIDAPTFRPIFATFIPWVMLIVGGSGNNKGAILGAFLVWGIWSLTDFGTAFLDLQGYQIASLRYISVAVLLELVLLFRPQGILGERKAVLKKA